MKPDLGSQETENVTLKKKRVLVVDDDPVIRTMVQAILEAEGYEVLCAEDGIQGVEAVEKQTDPTDLSFIILDVVMPGMNGLDVVTRLRLQSKTAKIPILMLTGEDKAEDIMAGYSVGADYYITKPFTRQQLLFGIGLVLNGWEDK